MEGIQIILAIGIPALSGLAYLAYKHPHAYEKLSLPFTWFSVGSVYIVGYCAWFYGAKDVYDKLLPLIPPNKTKSAVALFNPSEMFSPSAKASFLVWFVLWFYFVFLGHMLPDLLRKEE